MDMNPITDAMQWRKKIKQWLEPMGFQPIWSHNHPTLDLDKVHYIKNGIRLCCERERSHEWFYLLDEFWKDHNGRSVAMSTRTAITSHWAQYEVDQALNMLKRCRLAIKYNASEFNWYSMWIGVCAVSLLLTLFKILS